MGITARSRLTARPSKSTCRVAAPRAWQGDAGRVQSRWLEGVRMGIADQLTAMRRDFPACRVATFADLSSGLVLFTSTSRRLPQERLDALCARARALLLDPPGRTGAALLGGPAQQAVMSEGKGSRPRAVTCRARRGDDLPLRRRHRPARLRRPRPAGTRGARGAVGGREGRRVSEDRRLRDKLAKLADEESGAGARRLVGRRSGTWPRHRSRRSTRRSSAGG
jgi:hypothetical protein